MTVQSGPGESPWARAELQAEAQRRKPACCLTLANITEQLAYKPQLREARKTNITNIMAMGYMKEGKHMRTTNTQQFPTQHTRDLKKAKRHLNTQKAHRPQEKPTTFNTFQARAIPVIET